MQLIHFLETSPGQITNYPSSMEIQLNKWYMSSRAENVLSEAYVLPTIEKVGDKFPDNVESADYYCCHS